MKILLADDDRDIREALALIVEGDPSMIVLGAVADADEAILLAERTHPDVAILDVRMPKGGGTRAAMGIRRVSPTTKIIALSGSREGDAVIRMLRAGAMSFLVKGASAAEIRRAINDAASDTPTLAPGATRELLGSLRALDRDDTAGRERAEARAQIERFLVGQGTSVAFQPLFDLADMSIVGYEALSRFDAEPRRPDIWFQRAHEAGLGEELEIVMFSRALEAVSLLPPDTFLSVNLSPGVLASKGADDLDLGEAPDRLVIELTEHAAVDDYARLNGCLADLRTAGVRFAVDDAGAGFASLHHILQLAPEFIKLDTSLTRDIDHDSPRRALAASLITFAAEINSTIIAEGIERKGEHEALRDLGVRLGQGYHLARPATWLEVFTPAGQALERGRISEAIPDCHDPTEVVATLAEILSPRLPLTRVSIRTVTRGNRLVVRAVWSKVATQVGVGMTMSIPASTFPEILRRGGPVSSSDRADTPPLVEQILGDEGVRSWISIPLHDPHEGIIGCISFSSEDADAFPEATADGLGAAIRHVEDSIVSLLRKA